MKTCFELILWILPAWQSVLFGALAFLFYLRGEGYHRLMLSLYMGGSFLFFMLLGAQKVWSPVFLSETVYGVVWLMQLPLFYLFLKSLLEPGYLLRRREIRHFAGPLLAGAILFFTGRLTETGSDGIGAHISLQRWHILFNVVMMAGFILQFIIYLVYSWKRYPRHMQLIFNYYSDPEPYSLHWLRWLLFSFVGLFFLLDVFRIAGVEIFSPSFPGYTLLILILNFGIGFFGLTQPVLFYEHRRTESVEEALDTLVAPEPEAKVVVSEGLQSVESADEVESAKLKALFEQAQKMMEKNKLYEDPDLTLGDLAKALNVNTIIFLESIDKGRPVSESTTLV